MKKQIYFMWTSESNSTIYPFSHYNVVSQEFAHTYEFPSPSDLCFLIL
jgi:hypothetical protein